jgi:hypothetical protein
MPVSIEARFTLRAGRIRRNADHAPPRVPFVAASEYGDSQRHRLRSGNRSGRTVGPKDLRVLGADVADVCVLVERPDGIAAEQRKTLRVANWFQSISKRMARSRFALSKECRPSGRRF